MAEILYDNFADLQSLEEEKKKILSIFDDIKAGILDLSALGIKIDGSKSVRETAAAYEAAKKQLSALQLNLREYGKIADQIAVKEAKLNATRSQEGQSLDLLNNKIKESNKIRQERIKLSQVEEGSIDQLQLKIAKATRIYESLGEAQRNSGRGQNLLKFIQSTGTELSKLEQKTGNFRRNVGNYANSLAGGFELVRREIANLQRQKESFTIAGDTRGVEAASRQIEGLDNIIKISLDNTKTFNQVVKELGNQYQNLAASGEFSEEFLKQFAQFAAEARDRADDLKTEIKALSSDTRGFDLMAGAISTIASGLEAAAGASALFGGNTEDVQRSIQKLIAIQSVANGVREVAKQITEKGTAANKAYNFVLEQGTILFGKGSTAAQRFGAALKSIVVLAVVVGIIELIKQLDIFGKSAAEKRAEVDKLNESMESLYQTTKKITELTSQNPVDNLEIAALKRKLALQEANGASLTAQYETKRQIAIKERDLAEKQIDDLLKRGDALDEAVDGEMDGYDQIEKAQQDFFEKTVQGNQELKNLRQQRLKGDKELTAAEKENYDNAIKDQEAYVNLVQGQYDEYTAVINNAIDKQQALETLQAEERKRRADAERENARDRLENQIKDLERLKKEQDEIVANPTTDNRLRLSALEESAQLEIEILQKQAALELSQKGISAEKIKGINKTLLADIFAANKEALKRRQQLEDEFNEKKRADIQESVDFFEKTEAEKFQIQLDNLNKQLSNSNDFADQLASEEIKAANEAFVKKFDAAKGNDKKQEEAVKERNQRLEDIERQHQVTLLQNQINYFKTLLKINEANGLDTGEQKKALAAAEAALSDFIANRTISNNERITDSENKKHENLLKNLSEVQDRYSTFTDTISSLFDAFNAREKAKLDEQLDSIDRRKEAEIDRINASTDSEEKKAARIKVVEAKAKVDRDRIERERRRIDFEKAKFEKIAAIGTITLQTAINIVKAFGNPINVALAAAIGASQLAVAIATPLPRYAKGKKASDPYTGPAIWGEAGREMKISRTGTVSISPNRATLTELMRGDVILPADVTKNILNATQVEQSALLRAQPVTHDDRLTKLIGKFDENNRLLRELKDKPMIVHTEIHNNADWNAYIEQHVKR